MQNSPRHGSSTHASGVLRHFRHPIYGLIQLLTALFVALQPMNYVSGDDPPVYSISLSADQVTLDPGQSTTLYALLRNETTNQPLAGYTVQFSVTSGDGTLGQTEAVTDVNGIALVSFTGGSSDTVIHVADGDNLSAAADGVIEVTESPPTDIYELALLADQTTLAIDKSTTLHARLSLWDDSLTLTAPVAGATINFMVPSGDGALSATTAITAANGEATVTFTGGYQASQVNAWDGHNYDTSASVALDTTGAGPPYAVVLWADDADLLPGETQALHAQVLDMSNNNTPVGGVVLNFSMAFGDGFISSLSETTDGSGMAMVNFTGGENRTQVDVRDVSSGWNTANSFTFGVQGDAVLTLAVQSNPLAPGAETQVQAELLDGNGVALPNTAIQFTVNSGDGTLSAPTAYTDEYGRCAVTFTGGLVQTELAARDLGDLGTATSVVIGVGAVSPAPPARTLTLWADNSTLAPGQASVLNGSLVEDGSGMGVPGEEVIFTVISGDGTFTGGSTQIAVTTDENGYCFVNFTAGVLTAEVTVTDGGSASNAFSFGIVAPGTLSLWADRNGLTPGESVVLHAQLTDGNNAPVAGAALSFTVETGDGTLSSSEATTDGNGNAEVTFTGGANPSEVRAAAVGGGLEASQTYAFGVVVHEYSLTLWGDATSLDPGAGTTVHAKLEDLSASAVVSGATIQFNILSGDGTLGATSATTDETGVCSVPFTGGSAATVINAADGNGLGTSVNGTIEVTTYEYHLSVAAEQSTVAAGQATPVTALLVNTTTNTAVSGAYITFSATEGTGRGSIDNPGGYTDSEGRVQVTFTGGTLFPTEITVTGADLTASCIMSVTHSDTFELVLNADVNPLDAGMSTTLHAQLMNTTQGTPVPGATLAFGLIAGNGVLGEGNGVITLVTGEDGACAVGFTAGAEYSIVRVTDASGFGTSADYTFAPPEVPEYVDTDGDGWWDHQEIAAGTDPNDPASNPGVPPPPADADGDGWSDDVESAAGTDPNDATSYPGSEPPDEPEDEPDPLPGGGRPALPSAPAPITPGEDPVLEVRWTQQSHETGQGYEFEFPHYSQDEEGNWEFDYTPRMWAFTFGASTQQSAWSNSDGASGTDPSEMPASQAWIPVEQATAYSVGGATIDGAYVDGQMAAELDELAWAAGRRWGSIVDNTPEAVTSVHRIRSLNGEMSASRSVEARVRHPLGAEAAGTTCTLLRTSRAGNAAPEYEALTVAFGAEGISSPIPLEVQTSTDGTVRSESLSFVKIVPDQSMYEPALALASPLFLSIASAAPNITALGRGRIGDIVYNGARNGVNHFVSPKWFEAVDGRDEAGARKDEHVILTVAGFTAADFTDPDGVEWHIDKPNVGAPDPADPTKFRVKRDNPEHCIVSIKKKSRGATLAKMHVWIVEVVLTPRTTAGEFSTVIPGFRLGLQSQRWGYNPGEYNAKTGIEWIGLIYPPEIVAPENDEKPPFYTQYRLRPPDHMPSPMTNTEGVPSDGPPHTVDAILDANGHGYKGWDMTRQIKRRVWKGPSLAETTEAEPGGYFFRPTDYPQDPASGNDDYTGAFDEDDNPYHPGSGDAGELLSYDRPELTAPDDKNATQSGAGVDGDRLHVKRWFREIARLQIHNRWYAVSDPASGLWRHHFFLKRIDGKWQPEPETQEKFDTTNDE